MSEDVTRQGASIAEERALNVGPAGIDIAYERLGSRNAPAVLLIMGAAAQLIHWPEAFCKALVDSGLQVIRFDNRDVGRSSHMTDAPAPDFPAVMGGDYTSVSYRLSDMAGDAVGLMDALGIDQAHVVGVSMGGQIAQTMAIDHPERVRSLISMSSTTGNNAVGKVWPEVLRAVFGKPVGDSREEVVQHRVMAMRVVGSPGYPMDEEEVTLRAGHAWDRGHDPAGIARQAIACIASGDRTEELRKLKVPTLVIHGLADHMVDVSGGRATADAIPGAEIVLIEGMGHDLAPGLRLQLASRIAEFIWRVEHVRSTN